MTVILHLIHFCIGCPEGIMVSAGWALWLELKFDGSAINLSCGQLMEKSNRHHRFNHLLRRRIALIERIFRFCHHQMIKNVAFMSLVRISNQFRFNGDIQFICCINRLQAFLFVSGICVFCAATNFASDSVLGSPRSRNWFNLFMQCHFCDSGFFTNPSRRYILTRVQII